MHRWLIPALLAAIVLGSGCGSADKSDTITFAGSGGYPPFNYINKENEVIGFDVDVAAEIARRLGKKMKYTTTAWDGIIEGLRAGRYDAILGSMAITPQREEVVAFSIPYYYSGAQLIVLDDSEIASPEAIDSTHTIGVTTGTTFEGDAKKLGAKVRLYEDDNQTLMELINGRVDGVITDRVVALNAAKKMNQGARLTAAGELLRREECAIALRRDSEALHSQIDSVLTVLHDDGTLSAISATWFDGADITRK